MAENKAFSHITVNADDDDDVVIKAGIVADGVADADAFPSEPEPAAEPAGEEAVEEIDEPAGDSEPAEEPAPAPAAAHPAPSADGYRETTLEDIESSKMGTVQKAVIVVALLGIVAFVVWFLLAR